MKRILLCGLSLLFAFALASTSTAQTGYPMLMSIDPIAVQQGTTSEVTIKSRYSMHGTFDAFVLGGGVTVEPQLPEEKADDKKDAKPPNLTSLKVKVTVTADAKPGVRDLRLITDQGASTIAQLVVVRDPVVVENPKNDTPETAQEVSLPATICGNIERAEDVDFYKFHAEAGTSLSFHIRCGRLQDRIHDLQTHADPILTLRGPSGSTLAASDNHFFADPFLSYTFERAGDYLLEIRDVRYSGNGYWNYCLEANGRPFISQVYPLGVVAGEEAKLELVGANLPAESQLAFAVPADLPPGEHWLQLPLGDELTDPVPLVVTNLPHVLETDAPNNETAEAQTISVPAAISGRVESEGDLDCFTFEAKKDETFDVEVIARRQQSDLDPHIRILGDKDRQLVENDDFRLGQRLQSDSFIENWKAPADGKYTIQIRDLHLRGGAGFVYFIKVTKSGPRFELYADTDKTLLNPGGSGIFYVKVFRKNGFTGEIELHVDGLPKGVTATCGRILAGKSDDGCIVLTAAADAPKTYTNIRIWGTAKHEVEGAEPLELSDEADIYQETYQPGGGRGHWPVPIHTISIGEIGDIADVKISTDEVVLKPGESKRIEIEVVRNPAYEKNVTLDARFYHLREFCNSLPEGVTIDVKNSKTLLNGKESKGFITLKADEKAAPAEKQLIPIMAHVSLNFVMKRTISSKPVFVTVLPAEETAEAKK